MGLKKSETFRFSPRSRSVVNRSATTIMTSAGVIALVMTGMTSSFASTAPAQTTFVNGVFSGISAGSGYALPSASSGTNGACLTASSNTTVTATNTVPGCGGTLDLAGNGVLRLTSAQTEQTGGVGATQSIPIAQGLDASFDSYQYNGTDNWSGNTGDGIGFYLAATDPYNPTVPTQIGQLGGSLGYSNMQSTGGTGLSHAYLGLGLDRYGNFVTPGYEGNDCSGNTHQRSPNSVTVRGPGNGSTGYCLIATTAGTQFTGNLSATGVANRSQARVPVEIVINPTSSTLAAQQHRSVTVRGGTFAVIFTPIGGPQQVLTGTLPKLSMTNNDANIPASWIDPATGYPDKLTYGWVASTGTATDIHEVSSLQANTAAGPVPVLSTMSGGNIAVTSSGSGTYTLAPTVTSGGGSESQLVRTTTTFPADTQPTIASAPGTGWSCTISGQVETCDYAASVSNPLPPGTDLPPLSLPFTVQAGARSATISTVLASTDAEAFTASQTVTLKQAVHVTATNATAQYGTAATLSATGLPSGATGTLIFFDNGSRLCSVTLPSTTCLTSSSLAPGIYTVTVDYSGDSVYGSSISGSAQLTVARESTTLSANSTTQDRVVTLTAGGLPPKATGTITFRNTDGTGLCTLTLPSSSCTTAALATGEWAITATYSGDAYFAPSTRNITVTVINNPSRSLADTGSIVGIGLPTALALACVVIGLCLFLRRRRRVAR